MVNTPSNLHYGTVVGRFILAYADSADEGSEPDVIPAKGSIFFKPSPISLKNTLAEPSAVTILPTRVEATLDSEGYLCGYGTQRGIILVATENTQIDPYGWTWTAEFRLTDADGTAVPMPSFSFTLGQAEMVDLTMSSPVPDSNGVYTVRGPIGLQGEKGDKGDTGPMGSLEGLSASAPITYVNNTIGFNTTLLAEIDGGTA